MFEFKKGIMSISVKEQKSYQLLIDPDSVVSSQIDVSTLVCSICHQILWQPVMCSIPQGCHTYFCSTCIQSWIQNQISKLKLLQSTELSKPSCPQCKHHLILSSPPPLLKCLLSNLKIKCTFSQNGCDQVLGYFSIEQHAINECRFRNVTCEGCKESIVWKDYQKHTEECELFMVKCIDCGQKMTKKHYLKQHLQQDAGEQNNNFSSPLRTVQCYSNEIANYNKSISIIETKTTDLSQRLSKIQNFASRLITNTPMHLPIVFQTNFNQHFSFTSLAPTLIKSSFNPIKNRNEFLHFYITSPICLNSLLPLQWRLSVTKMKGNILLGFCSSIGGESIDLIVNKYGEVKKKDHKENRYKLVKRVERFIVEEKDVIGFCYDGRNKFLKVSNQTKNISIQLGKEYIEIFRVQKEVKSSNKQCIFAFYSMDTVGDKITFMPEK